MDRRFRNDIGFLPVIAVGTLFVFYVVWAAMHDIAQGEIDATLEYAALIVSLPVFAFLYRMALLYLLPKARVVWLGGTGLLIFLFGLAAMNVRLHPKHAQDSMVASLFLMAGVPVLGLIGYHLARETLRLRTRPGS